MNQRQFINWAKPQKQKREEQLDKDSYCVILYASFLNKQNTIKKTKHISSMFTDRKLNTNFRRMVILWGWGVSE